MYQKTIEATNRAWKFDNKYIWTLIFLVGNVLGYAIPESFDGFIPFADKTQVEALDKRVDDLELKVFNTTVEEPVVEPEPEPLPSPTPKLKVERGNY